MDHYLLHFSHIGRSRNDSFLATFGPFGRPKRQKKRTQKRDQKKQRKKSPNRLQNGESGIPQRPQIVQKSMKNHLWDRPGAVGPLLTSRGGPGGGYPLQNHPKMTKISSESMPRRPPLKGQTWTKNAADTKKNAGVSPCFSGCSGSLPQARWRSGAVRLYIYICIYIYIYIHTYIHIYIYI